MAYQPAESGELSDLDQPDATEPVVLGRIDHVALAVRDAQAAAAHFAASLGLKVVGDEVVDAAGVRLMYLMPTEPDGCLLQLVQPIQPGPVLDHLDRFGEGFHHLCFRCNDLVRTLERIPGESTAAIFAGGGGAPCAFLPTPIHGARIELMEKTENSPIDGVDR
jgi:methylmalonyl-CoA/ethylmalonyl-CoA epimerase